MIKYAIVDDEPIAHRIIEGFAQKVGRLEKVGNCYDALEAMQLLQTKQVDLLFLDIKMPELSGLEFLQTLKKRPKVIITSAYQEYALQGYEFDVIDYLLKPFSFARFLKAANKVIVSDDHKTISHSKERQHIFIKADKKQHRVDLEHILYIEAAGNYSKIVLKDQTIMTLKKISDFEKMLPDDFIRVHNSFIISKNKVKVIEGNLLDLGNGHKVPVGQTYRSVLRGIYDD